MTKKKIIRIIDLFAGMGGTREGFEQACKSLGYDCQCVFTSEIKDAAVSVLKQNHPKEIIHGDITKVSTSDIPDFDFLLAGFPCQPFSYAGKREGFADTRGTLFFEIERILKDKKPMGFLLENVEGLVSHDKKKSSDKIGRTFNTILSKLKKLGYNVSWKVLDSSEFGDPQKRKRVYIVGSKKDVVSLDDFVPNRTTLDSILETGLETENSEFIKKLLSNYKIEELPGKSIKDKRGGENNIHSWDISTKGKTSKKERELLNQILIKRRYKKWAEEYGIDWMDGMPLTLEMIKSFSDIPNLEETLNKLVKQGYLKMEHPKRKDGTKRVEDTSLPIGYNIVTGKMSFEINQILAPDSIAPTMVAMDMSHIYVVDGKGLRKLSLKEGLGLFGYPKDFKFNVSREEGYDLLGNTVVVPVIKEVSKRILEVSYGR